MREFFKPWRRKFGVLTLGMACVFMGAWMKSLFSHNTFTLYVGRYTFISIVSVSSRIGFIELTPVDCERLSLESNREQREYFLSPDNQPGEEVLLLQMIEHFIGNKHFISDDWQFPSCGFYIATESVGTPHGTLRGLEMITPYWSIVIPITVLSAWLLLSKPRQKPTAKTDSSNA